MFEARAMKCNSRIPHCHSLPKQLIHVPILYCTRRFPHRKSFLSAILLLVAALAQDVTPEAAPEEPSPAPAVVPVPPPPAPVPVVTAKTPELTGLGETWQNNLSHPKAAWDEA